MLRGSSRLHRHQALRRRPLLDGDGARPTAHHGPAGRDRASGLCPPRGRIGARRRLDGANVGDCARTPDRHRTCRERTSRVARGGLDDWHGADRHARMLLDDARRRAGARRRPHERKRLGPRPDGRHHVDRHRVVPDRSEEVRRLDEHPPARVNVDDAARTERAPAGVPAAPTPRDPGRRPDAPGQPHPSRFVDERPASVMIGRPAPRLLGHPGPARRRPDPSSVPIRLPVPAHVPRLPDPSVFGGCDPAAVRAQPGTEIIHRRTGGVIVDLGRSRRVPSGAVIVIGRRRRVFVFVLRPVTVAARILAIPRLRAVLVVAGPMFIVLPRGVRAGGERDEQQEWRELAEHDFDPLLLLGRPACRRVHTHPRTPQTQALTRIARSLALETPRRPFPGRSGRRFEPCKG